MITGYDGKPVLIWYDGGKTVVTWYDSKPVITWYDGSKYVITWYMKVVNLW